ncbi:MAG TPA: histidine phosphatase family protein [Cyanothece sp. UBA12306]|nr:histidine phosphatase family protein [Cyanothece sp. UBA12306]
MSLTLYFLRHGETNYSLKGGYCGVLDPDLTDHGQQMAEAFAQTYKSFPWSGIYVSPMKRTIATAKPLCDALGMSMQIKDGLKEMNFGDWEDQSPEWVKENHLDDYINWMTEPAWNPPTGGETAVEVASRAMLVISEIEAKHLDGNVLVVSHKTTIRIIICNLLGIDLGRYRDRIDMLAASVTQVKFGVHGPLLQKLGDRSYMGEELESRKGS